MDTGFTKIKEEIDRLHANSEIISKLTNEIEKLDGQWEENLSLLREKLTKLSDAASKLDSAPDLQSLLLRWVETYKRTLAGYEDQQKKRFGVEMSDALKQQGLSLAGQYPELRAGIFTIELAFEKQRATLWYGPKQEQLGQCSLTVDRVAKAIKSASDELGVPLEPGIFLSKLGQACERVGGAGQGGGAPIIAVLSEMAHLMQSPQFHRDPRRGNYRTYGRAEFSYDLARTRGLSGSDGSRLHLTVATRAFTERRAGFLWVPNDVKTSDGAYYSHLQVRRQ